MKHKMTLLLVLTLILNVLTIETYAEKIEINAGSAILIDADTGNILYEKDAYSKHYPASITKIMTSILAFESDKELTDDITYSRNAVFSIERGSSHIAIDVDEVLTLEQALHALLMVSANDAANGIAEFIDESIEDFAKHMTTRAKELGAKNTNFTNPHGLHNSNHYTTAFDMSLIAKEALKYPLFKEIVKKRYYEIPPNNKKDESRYLGNQHKMLLNTSYKYEPCQGGKTGYTDQARHTLITYAKKGDTNLICVILNGSKQMYADTIKLFDFGFNNYSKLKLLSKNSIMKKVPVFNSDDDTDDLTKKLGYIDVIAADDFVYYGSSNLSKDDIEIKTTLPDNFKTPIFKNDIVGEVQFINNGTILGTVPLLSTKTYDTLETDIATVIQQDSISSPERSNIINPDYITIVLLVLVAVGILYIIIKLATRRRR